MAAERVSQAMQQAVEEGVFPGAALLVASRGEVLYRGFFGSSALKPRQEPILEGTLFDIASLTKPVATASLALLAVREKGLALNSPVVRYCDDFATEDKDKITIRHLLKHTSGLPAWKPYFEEIAREHPELIGKRSCREVYSAKIGQEPLEMPIAYQRIYSDLGYILLGILLEHFWERPLDDLFREKIAAPLGLKNTFFAPVGASAVGGLSRSSKDFAATEDSAWRKRLIRGEVHDDNAYALGGVAGHAGLFSHVDDLHAFLQAVRQGYREGHPVFPRELSQEFIGPKVKFKLGWDTPADEASQAGKFFSQSTIGHLGYTGCSFWIDLEKDFHIILLTNRVHPSTKNEAIKTFRPHLHDLIYEELIRM